MNTLRAFLLIAVTLGSSSSFAAFLAVDLQPKFVYQDYDRYCSVGVPWKTISVNGVVDGDKLVSATLRSTDKRFELLPEELTGVVMKRDTLGEYYLDTLPLGARVLNWIFFHLDGWVNVCQPSKALATLAPYGHTYRFTQSNGFNFFAVVQRFRGTRSDGGPYVLKLGFLQTHQ
jgi:hypothetical protein